MMKTVTQMEMDDFNDMAEDFNGQGLSMNQYKASFYMGGRFESTMVFATNKKDARQQMINIGASAITIS